MVNKIAIIGGGLTGCTMARLLGDEGFEIDLFEKNMVGGLCADTKKEGIMYQRFGPHLFHTNNKAVWDFVNKFGKFNDYKLKVKANINNELVELPVNINTLSSIFKAKLDSNSARQLISALRIDFPHDIKNAEEDCLSRFGRIVYETIFENYTFKQWKKHPSELDASITRRIPLRFNKDDRYFTDKYQGVPIKGFNRLFYEMLDLKNINVLSKDVKVDEEFKKDYDLIIYTGRIDEYFKYKHGKMDYRCTKFDFQIKKMQYFQECCIVTYPSPKFKITRVTEFKHATKQKINNTIICRETPMEVNSSTPLYPLLNLRNKNLLTKYVKLVMKEDKVIFAGRLGTFKYLNMDQSIEECMKILRGVVSSLK